MFDSRERMIYYVSNVGGGKLSIIDGNDNYVINEIEIGSRPQHIVVDDNDNVYIASDRKNEVTIIHDFFNIDKTWNIPNNGNIQVDSISQKIYVSNTEEICIYNLKTGKKIHSITGFAAADRLELDKSKKRLFVLDILQCEIKIFNTENLQYIKSIKRVGNGPCDILLGTDEKYLYVANKGLKKEKYAGNISIINIETGKIAFINIKKGSSITALEQSRSHIYAANSGLQEIEIINKQKKQRTALIKTTLPIIQRIRLCPDQKTLLAISRNSQGKNVLDIIDTASHVILETLTFEENNSYPYDIRVITQKEPEIEKESLVLAESEVDWKEENGTTILAKEIISVYQEKILFNEMTIDISPNNEEQITNIEEIVFQKCKMVNETIIRTTLHSRKDYSILQYDFYIPYYIEAKNQQEQIYRINGKIDGSHKATLFIPNYAEQKGIQFAVNTFAKLIKDPIINNNNLQFDVSVLISTKVIVDKIVFVPFCKACKEWHKKGEEERESNVRRKE